MLTVIDEYSREALSVTVANTMGLSEVLEVLYPLLLKRGKPEYLRTDNGPEFSSELFKDWLTTVGIKPIRIYPGPPWGESVKQSLQWSYLRSNGYNERFNGTLHREGLNAEWIGTTHQAETVINQWLKQYNQIRPHQALRIRPLAPETILENRNVTPWYITRALDAEGRTSTRRRCPTPGFRTYHTVSSKILCTVSLLNPNTRASVRYLKESPSSIRDLIGALKYVLRRN